MCGTNAGTMPSKDISETTSCFWSWNQSTRKLPWKSIRTWIRRNFPGSSSGYRKVQETEWEVKEGALAQELIAKEPYVQAYINFFLGNVIKCESIEELRQNRIGITADCVLYHSFRLQHINPENYTRRAYIGETSMRQRIRRLEEKCESLQEERIPLQEMLEEIRRISQLEGLTQPLEDYRQWLSDLQKIPEKEAEKARLLDTMQKLREESVLVWEQQKQEIQQKQEAKKAEIEAVQKTIWNHQENGKRFQNMQVDFNEQLVQKENEFRQQDRENMSRNFRSIWRADRAAIMST